ncbi:MAG: sialidase family protein [Odoribacter sp.]|nr:sialidase family protein [Odoribacter sp.]
MKKCLLYIYLALFAQTVFANDTLYVREQQIPILLDRADNVLCMMRISAQKGDVLNQLTMQFTRESSLDAIQAVRLYYAGTEAPERKGLHFNPANYISSHTPGKTRMANPSYSVKQDETTLIKNSITLHSEQPLLKGTNYFWVSIQMKPQASLQSKVSFTLPEALINNQPATIAWQGKAEAPRRVGIGVRQAGDDGSAAYRIPGLVTSNRGTLLGVYDIRYNSSVDLQEKVDIGVSRSTDKGQTWEPMRIAMTFGETGGLPHAQNGVGDPSILVDEKTNTIWIVAAWTHGMGNGRAWNNSMPGMTPDETAQLMLVKSEDDGKTWSQPINITSQVKHPSWYFLLQGPGRGITMKDGTLVFPIQFIDSTRIPNAGIMYSKDRGKTWHLHNLARTNTTEAQVAEIEPGTLMLNMRDNRGGSRAVAITKDLGKTWTEHPSSRKALQEPVCMASLLKVEAKDNITGKPLLLFSNPNTTRGRHHITIKASLDNGLTWSPSQQALLDEGESWGYSCLTLIDKETIGILYESSVAHMTFQAVKIKDLIK